jgi:hypothetical protein
MDRVVRCLDFLGGQRIDLAAKNYDIRFCFDNYFVQPFTVFFNWTTCLNINKSPSA